MERMIQANDAGDMVEEVLRAIPVWDWNAFRCTRLTIDVLS